MNHGSWFAAIRITTGSWEFPNLFLFLTWLFAILTRKRSFALFSALLRSFANSRLRSFALICTLLRSFALFCVFLRTNAFRTTAFGNSRGSQQFQIARFQSQGQKPFESLLRLYNFSLFRSVSDRAIRFASDSNRARDQ